VKRASGERKKRKKQREGKKEGNWADALAWIFEQLSTRPGRGKRRKGSPARQRGDGGGHGASFSDGSSTQREKVMRERKKKEKA